MFLIALNFWSIVVYFFLAGLLFVSIQLVLALARYTDDLIARFAQMGMYKLARALLIFLINYDERTYRKSRFVLWNQVYIRFAILWGSAILTAALLFLFQVPSVVWVPVLLVVFIYRMLTLWMNPARPPIYTRDPTLKQLIQDVNEPMRTSSRSVGPLIRHWDYLDELFAESA